MHVERDELLEDCEGLRRRLGNVKPREIEALAERAGWRFSNQSGSHRVFIHAGMFHNLSIPMHTKPIPNGLGRRLLKVIEESINLSEEDGRHHGRERER